MKIYSSIISEVMGGKISMRRIRQLMGFIDKKTDQYLVPTGDTIDAFRPSIMSHDFNAVAPMIRRFFATLKRRDAGSDINLEALQLYSLSPKDVIDIKFIGIYQTELQIHRPLYQIIYEGDIEGPKFLIGDKIELFYTEQLEN